MKKLFPFMISLLLSPACNQSSKTTTKDTALDSTTSVEDTTSWSGTPVSTTFIYRLNKNQDSISIASVNLSDGSLVEHDEYALGGNASPLDAVTDSTKKFLYVAQSDAGTIGRYSIDQTTGLLTWLSDTSTYPLPSKMVLHPNGNFLYTLHADNSQISIHAIDSSTGALTFVLGQSVSGPGAKALAIHPAGNTLFAASNSYFRSYTVNSTTGLITYSGYQSPQFYHALKTTSTGSRLYAVSGMYSQFWGFDINTGTGTVTSTSMSTGHQIFPYTNIEFSSNDSFAYTINDFKHSLEFYSVNASGYLSYINGFELKENCSPRALNYLKVRGFIFTACSDTSGKTYSFKVNVDGSVSDGKSSTVPGVEISSIVVVEL